MDYYERSFDLNGNTLSWNELKFKMFPDVIEPKPKPKSKTKAKPKKTTKAKDFSNGVDETNDAVIEKISSSIWKMSQHVFCYSFGTFRLFFNKKYSYFSFVDQARINTMLKLLYHSYPRIVNANFSPYFLQKEANLWQEWQSQILNTVSVKGPNFDANELRTPQVF